MPHDETHVGPTDSDFGDRLIEALTEAVAIERGQAQPPRVSRRPAGLTPSPAAIIDLTD